MKRRIVVLCLLLALVFMAMAPVPVDAVGILLVKNVVEVEDPPNRFCVGKPIHYEMIVGNPVGAAHNITVNVTDTYPNGVIEQLDTGLYLAIGKNKSYNRSYVVEDSDVGWIENTLSAKGTTELGTPVSASLEMPSFILDPIINITKVASPTSGALGTDVNFTITVTNTGDCTLEPVKVVDTLPVGMSFVFADSGGIESPPGSGTIIWDLGTMVSGATHAPIHLVAHIDVGAAGPLTNNVLATGTPENSICDDVTDSDDAVVTVTYSIAGMKFNDLNGNGVKDAGEPGLPGWTINLAGPVSGTRTTAADGSYAFTNLEPGDYTVSEVLKAGWVQTCPPTPGTYSVTLTDTNATDKDFGNRGAMSISGMKFNDLNGNGVKDAGEPGLPYWTINLVGPVNGTTTTAADGSYSFTNLEPGDYTVSEVLKAGWVQTCPTTPPGTYSVMLTDSPVIDRDFGNRGAMSISGMKFNDLNGNGVKDAGEPGLPYWTINLVGPVNGTTTTAADGSYSFTNLEPGDYTVSETVKAGWVQTCPPTPGTYSVTLTDSPVIDRDFGNRGALSISGMKFNDLNGDGVKDAGEPGLSGWTINLAGPVSGTTTTAADGSYTFTNLELGDYTVSEVLQAGWVQTCPAAPGTYSVTLTDTSATDKDFGNGAPSIEVVKTASLTGACPGSDPLAVSIGDTVTYCFNVTNTGDVNLTGITVVDDIYGPVTPGTTTLAPGESTGGTITHVVVESDAPSVTNTATATGTDPFGGTVTDTDDCTIKAMIDPEIYVNKTAHPTEGTVGTDITYTINVTNTGDCTLNPVKVIDELQPGLSYVSSDPPADTHNGILIWNNVGPLVPGQSTTITVVALIDTEAVGVLNNTVTATGTDPLGGLVTDNDTAQVAVISVGLEKSGSPTTVAPGGIVTYTINYTNNGAAPLHDVIITENYPNGVTFISASPAPDAGTNNVWTIGTLLPGESGTIVIKVKVPEQVDLSFTETGSVIGEGVVMVTKDLSTEQKPYSLRNSVTLSCAELDPVSRYATTKVSGVPGTSLGITESGSGVYSSDEILDLQTKNKSIILKKTTHAEYKPTSFNFSDSFSINFTNKWKQDICSRNMEIGAAIHKKISDATYIDDETISRVDENKSIMNFDSSFNGSMYIGARTKDTAISETYIGEFDVLQRIQIAKGPIPTPAPTPTPTPIWLPCPFNASQEMNMTEEAELTHDAKIKIEKSANRTSATVGDVIRYSYVVTNIGNINLTGVTVMDSNLGLVDLNRTELEPTEVANGTLLYTVNQSDVCANITNTADVTATDGCGDPVTNTSNQVIVTTDS